MNTPTHDRHDRRLWQQLWGRLQAARLDPLPSPETVDALRSALAATAAPGATLAERVRQAVPEERSATILAFPSLPFKQARFRPLAEIRLMAAASGLERYRIPDEPIVTPDQRFRLHLRVVADGLSIRVETLGAACVDYAGKFIGLGAGPGLEQVAVIMQLDHDGIAEAVVPDSEAMRRVLCVRPVIGLVEDGER